MRYHVHSIPVWDAYKSDCGCPLCNLSVELESKALKLYAGDAVMSPEYRIAVNERGFCEKHARLLYGGDNKLGLALQLETRLAYLKTLPLRVNSAKQAFKLADKLESVCSCVICEDCNKSLARYYATVAELYDIEPEFRTVFHASEICYKHSVELLRTASFCKQNRQPYIDAICYKLTKTLEESSAELNEFAEAFDYAKGKQRTADPDAIPHALNLLYGKQVKPQK